jgi:peptidoglycan hydrolase-like protein with peptidoglycan-binding domain
VYGYATPKYATASNPTGPTGWMEKIMKELSTLQKGSTGYDVWTLQGLLNARMDGKQKPLGIDGGFGPGTEARVKEEQKQHGLAADGVVGKHTWAVLITGKDVA